MTYHFATRNHGATSAVVLRVNVRQDWLVIVSSHRWLWTARLGAWVRNLVFGDIRRRESGYPA